MNESLDVGGAAWLIRVESIASEMRIRSREFASWFHKDGLRDTGDLVPAALESLVGSMVTGG